MATHSRRADSALAASSSRAVTLAAGAGPLTGVAVCLWSLVRTPVFGPPVITTPVVILLVATSLVSLTTAAAVGINGRLWSLAAALALAIAVPTISAAVHGFPDKAATPAAMGLAVAATAAAAPILTARAVRLGVLAILAAVVWGSLAIGAWTLVSGESAGLYQRGGRDSLGVLQLSGLPGHPNGMALLATMALFLQVLALPQSRQWRRGRRTVVLVLGPVASAAALIWTQSRTGLLTAALVAGVLAAVRFLPSRPGVTAGLLGLTAATSALPPAATLIGVAWSFHGRWFPWRVAWTLLEQDWLLGAGPIAFTPAFWDFWTRFQPASWEPAHAHNQLLESMVLLGLPGLTLLLVAAALMISVAARVGWCDGGWAIAVCVMIFVTAGPETVLGVGNVVATYLPALLTAAVLASSWQLAASGATAAGRRDQ